MAVLIKNIPMYHSNQLLKNIKHAIVVITDGINTPQNYFVITKKTALQYTLKKKKISRLCRDSSCSGSSSTCKTNDPDHCKKHWIWPVPTSLIVCLFTTGVHLTFLQGALALGRKCGELVVGAAADFFHLLSLEPAVPPFSFAPLPLLPSSSVEILLAHQ